MISGWRMYFTRLYWRLQWLSLTHRGKPLNILSVGTITIDSDETE